MKSRSVLIVSSVFLVVFFAAFGLRSLFRRSDSQTSRQGVGTVSPVSQPGVALERNAPRPTTTPATSVPPDLSLSTNGLFATAESFWDQPIAEEPFARFHDWVEQYQSAQREVKVRLESEGMELVGARRASLPNLIESNPER